MLETIIIVLYDIYVATTTKEVSILYPLSLRTTAKTVNNVQLELLRSKVHVLTLALAW